MRVITAYALVSLLLGACQPQSDLGVSGLAIDGNDIAGCRGGGHESHNSALVSLLLGACQPQSDLGVSGLAIDGNDIAGAVTSTAGPEAGVWVIAETDDLGTRFARIVVTDDEGRYLIPDLPEANYQLWVRGYGLVDSDKVAAGRGELLDLNATVAPHAAAAAQAYPAAYWFSMMSLPTEDEVAQVDGGMNGYLTWVKNMGCVGCHQLGNQRTRTIPASLADVGSSEEAWALRISSGQAGNNMIGLATGALKGLPIKYMAEWSDRIAAGELPEEVPERPSGVERNVVATVRDWSSPQFYMHDLSGTDRRDPTVNGYGKLYGAPELSTDEMPILDPTANTASVFNVPVRDDDTPTTNDAPVVSPSHYWGDERIWDSKSNIHNPMLDQDGRVWVTARIRSPDNPDFCREGSEHPSAMLYPKERAGRHLAVLDPSTGEYKFVDTCFQHPPSAIRLRRNEHALDERWWRRCWLARYQQVSGDGRRRSIARLGTVDSRYQWQRAAGCLDRAG